ncbi:MAG: hypothetical protein JRI44_14010 [Deltaproteobacteria bacterium]|nr:hypothetical protein [Deltaproteobacteria bacterium]
MTKEQLLEENRKLKDEIIELQKEIIRLKTGLAEKQAVKETKIVEREIIRERDYPSYPYYPIISYKDDTGTPLPDDLYKIVCWTWS